MVEQRKKEMEAVLTALRQIWETYPELRFGQLISNVLSNHGGIDPPGDTEFFYYTDQDTLEIIKNWGKRHGS